MKLLRAAVWILVLPLLLALPTAASAAKGGSKGKPRDANAFQLSLVMTRTGGGPWLGTFELQGALSDAGAASMAAGYDGCSLFQEIDLAGAIGSVRLSLGGPVECVGTTKGGKGYSQRDLVFGIYQFRDASEGYAALDLLTGSAEGVLLCGRSNDPTAERLEWTLTGTLGS